MRFEASEEHTAFAGSVRASLAGWAPPREPPLGEWWDEQDEDLARSLRGLGWSALWSGEELLSPAVAGAVELGRACAPLSLLDEATLGGPLAVGGRVRHGAGRPAAMLALPRGGLATAPLSEATREPALDGTGTLVAEADGDPLGDDAAEARWRVWGAATLGYQAGLADAALARGVAHARSREQFGAPLGKLPAVQALLADAAVSRDGLELSAWAAVTAEGFPADSLRWAGPACRDVTARVLQVHGAVGFALEGFVHVYYRRAKSVQVWTDAVLSLTA